MGEAAPLVREALADLLPVIDAASMREAVERGYEAARPDGVVLLAPACASFDWFRDYAERGRVFKEEVERLQERVSSEQSSVGRRGWELTAGNADYPGLRGGCPIPRAD